MFSTYPVDAGENERPAQSHCLRSLYEKRCATRAEHRRQAYNQESLATVQYLKLKRRMFVSPLWRAI
jgi:hypothetical protein